MIRRTPRTWSFATGPYGATVRAYERTPGGVLYLAAWDPTLRNGTGGYRRHSLGHRDRKAAEKEARRVVALLEAGTADATNPSLGYVFDLYRVHELPSKRPASAKWIRQHLALWEGYLGRAFRCRDLSTREWEGFKRDRLSGAIDAKGQPVPPESRRPVAPGTVNLGLDALGMAMNWARLWRHGTRPLLERSPVWRLPYLKDLNAQRAVWTHERYLAVLAAAEGMVMQVEWQGHREEVPCYLGDVLALAHETGRRIGAVRQLSGADLRLEEGPHGCIRWPASTDKGGKEWLTPISAEARARLLRLLRSRPSLGSLPLFPSPRNASLPVGRETLALFLRRALERAGLPRLPHDGFHGLRRKWAVERKHLPDADVMAAGGWRSLGTLKRHYQLADESGVLEAVLSPRRLREKSN